MLTAEIYRVYHAGKLGRHAVASRVNEAAPMLFNQPVDDDAMRGQIARRRFLILPHEAATAVDIGEQNGGEVAFHISASQFYSQLVSSEVHNPQRKELPRVGPIDSPHLSDLPAVFHLIELRPLRSLFVQATKRDLRFAATRWWSGGDSNCRSFFDLFPLLKKPKSGRFRPEFAGRSLGEELLIGFSAVTR